MHDLAKADREWQHYIRNTATVRNGPSHAPLGAALFAFAVEDLIPRWSAGDRALQRRLFDLSRDWTRIVYDHHGELKDLSLMRHLGPNVSTMIWPSNSVGATKPGSRP